MELRPGTQWRADRMLLSTGARSVTFVAGSTVCEQDVDGFFREECPPGADSDFRKPSWKLGLSRYELPFCLHLAAGLAAGWESHLPVCVFLERFTSFYRSNRTRVELAARELHFVLDGLFAVQPWPGLFQVLLDAMGEQAAFSLPKGVSAGDVASFLARLLIGAGPAEVSLARLPELLHTLRGLPTGPAEAFLRTPHHRRILENLERSTARVTPVLDQLRQALAA
jgi:hypothetical protein